MRKIEKLHERVEMVLADNDEETSHFEQDKLLEEYVRGKARRGDREAIELVRLLDSGQARWYA